MKFDNYDNLLIKKIYFIKEIIINKNNFDLKDSIQIIQYSDDEYLVKPLFKAAKILNHVELVNLLSYCTTDKNCAIDAILADFAQEKNHIINDEVRHLKVESVTLKALIHATDDNYNNFYEKFYNHKQVARAEQLDALDSYEFRLRRFCDF